MEGPDRREEKMGREIQSRSRRGKERNMLGLGDDQDHLDKV